MEEEKEEYPDEVIWVKFDPDGDGFYISDQDAIRIHNRIQMLGYIRKTLIKSKPSFEKLYLEIEEFKN